MVAPSLLQCVFIPDLLVPVVKYLGDDNVTIRFVCKQAHTSLITNPSGIHTTMLTPQEQSEYNHYYHTETQKKDRKSRNKAKPYVTSLSRLCWAISALQMPLKDSTYYAAIENGTVAVVSWLRNNMIEVEFRWDCNVSAAAAKYDNLSILQWTRAQNPPCPWNKDVCSEAARNGHLAVLQWARAQNPPCLWDVQVCLDFARDSDVHDWIRSQ